VTADLEILQILRRHGVRFVVVGGHAVNFHGYARVTEDIDVVWLRSPDAENALLLALQELGAQYITRQIDPATGLERLAPVSASFIDANHLMMLWTRLGFVDLFDYVPGLPAEDLAAFFADSIEAEGIRYASLNWLVNMKKAAGRPTDLKDIEKLQG
jgi:hypothetical protein